LNANGRPALPARARWGGCPKVAQVPEKPENDSKSQHYYI
jgi:hypothetical protein